MSELSFHCKVMFDPPQQTHSIDVLTPTRTILANLYI